MIPVWRRPAPVEIFSILANRFLVYLLLACLIALPVSPTDFVPQLPIDSKGKLWGFSNSAREHVDESLSHDRVLFSFLVTPDLHFKQATNRLDCCNRDKPLSIFNVGRTKKSQLTMVERSCGTHKAEDKTARNSLNSYSLDQALADLLDGVSLPSDGSVPDVSPLSSTRKPFSFSWQKPNPSSSNQETKSVSSPEFVATGSQVNPADSMSSDSTASISKLGEELENMRAEHRDINEISDQLAVKGQYAGGIQFQLVALKKRKLFLRDRIRSLELQLESLLRDSILEEEISSTNSKSSTDPVGTVLGEMMRRLTDLGLKPEQVPPHKDSFFLSLMKSLQRVGLRPNGYDFREGAVLGAERQFPDAAKRARFDVLKLLSSQADKLNGIGGWKLSSEEFQRYFAKSWWTLPAARDDLFMASAHLYSVRIVVFSIEAERLDEQVSLGLAPNSFLVCPTSFHSFLIRLFFPGVRSAWRSAEGHHLPVQERCTCHINGAFS
jgi:hypothetical protein